LKPTPCHARFNSSNKDGSKQDRKKGKSKHLFFVELSGHLVQHSGKNQDSKQEQENGKLQLQILIKFMT
jgi:hypothetical protein